MTDDGPSYLPPSRRTHGVRIDPIDEVTAAVPNSSSHLYEGRPGSPCSPSLKGSDGQPEKLAYLDFGQKSVGIGWKWGNLHFIRSASIAMQTKLAEEDRPKYPPRIHSPR
jgi:hypothetical protein